MSLVEGCSQPVATALEERQGGEESHLTFFPPCISCQVPPPVPRSKTPIYAVHGLASQGRAGRSQLESRSRPERGGGKFQPSAPRTPGLRPPLSWSHGCWGGLALTRGRPAELCPIPTAVVSNPATRPVCRWLSKHTATFVLLFNACGEVQHVYSIQSRYPRSLQCSLPPVRFPQGQFSCVPAAPRVL